MAKWTNMIRGKYKVALNHLGYYTPYKETGITDIPDVQVFEALKTFQKDQGLSPTGDVRPDDDTVKALNSATESNKKNPCEEQEKAYEEAKQNVKNLEYRKEKLTNELKELVEENNRIVKEMQQALGFNMATFIIEPPIKNIPILGELLRNYFANFISDEIMEMADRLAKERAVIYRKIEYKKKQLQAVLAQLKKAYKELEKAKEAFDTCMLNQ